MDIKEWSYVGAQFLDLSNDVHFVSKHESGDLRHVKRFPAPGIGIEVSYVGLITLLTYILH